jgi:hypothetical protein
MYANFDKNGLGFILCGFFYKIVWSQSYDKTYLAYCVSETKIFSFTLKNALA